jgi:hypothetical protein
MWTMIMGWLSMSLLATNEVSHVMCNGEIGSFVVG